MVEHPEDYLEGFREVGAKKVIFHYEASTSPQSVISQARGLGLEVGLAVNPETPVPAFLPLVDEVDSVLFLTVHPGFYGSSFLPEVLDKVVELRQSRSDLEIGVDGGINESNIVPVAWSGADVLCVGSAIFLHPNPAEKYYHLLELVEKTPGPGE
jgi:ribulose-phosphate 3-epimerase